MGILRFCACRILSRIGRRGRVSDILKETCYYYSYCYYYYYYYSLSFIPPSTWYVCLVSAQIGHTVSTSCLTHQKTLLLY